MCTLHGVTCDQVEQMPFHLNRAMDNGLTRAEASEVLTHLAFYAGWSNAFSALPVARDVFERVTLHDDFPEFLTLPAYEQLKG